jgi:Tfp pilus assembly protein PilF
VGRTVNRIDILKSFLEHEPGDSFSRYALALEYVKAGKTEEARRTFEFIVNHDPEYVATYFQLAQLYRSLGLKHEAEKTYRTGITAARNAGDSHTQSELEEALMGLLAEE